MKRMLAIACAGAMLLALASCSFWQKESSSSGLGSGSGASGSGAENNGDVSGESSSASDQETQSVSLYIGRDGDFYVYPQEIAGEVTPEAIIQSMTPAERAKPSIIDPKRKRRIAAGSGTKVEDVNRLLKQFEQMSKLLKQIKKSPRAFGRRFGLGRRR